MYKFNTTLDTENFSHWQNVDAINSSFSISPQQLCDSQQQNSSR